MGRRRPHRGSSFDSFLQEEGDLDYVTAAALQRIKDFLFKQTVIKVGSGEEESPAKRGTR